MKKVLNDYCGWYVFLNEMREYIHNKYNISYKIQNKVNNIYNNLHEHYYYKFYKPIWFYIEEYVTK